MSQKHPELSPSSHHLCFSLQDLEGSLADFLGRLETCKEITNRKKIEVAAALMRAKNNVREARKSAICCSACSDLVVCEKFGSDYRRLVASCS